MVSSVLGNDKIDTFLTYLMLKLCLDFEWWQRRPKNAVLFLVEQEEDESGKVLAYLLFSSYTSMQISKLFCFWQVKTVRSNRILKLRLRLRKRSVKRGRLLTMAAKFSDVVSCKVAGEM